MAMAAVVEFEGQQQLVEDHISIQHQAEMQSRMVINEMGCDSLYGDCAICLNKIVLEEAALVKGCEHAYCLTCILQWATYQNRPTCPQCKNPFDFLNIHRSLDGRVYDCMFEESVCLLLRASWFKPMILEEREDVCDEMEDYYVYGDDHEEDDLDEVYLDRSPSLRIGNRRWGDNGYVRAGRQEARPVYRSNVEDNVAGPSHERKQKEPSKQIMGRRAKRAMKREAADMAAAGKHQQHLARLGRK